MSELEDQATAEFSARLRREVGRRRVTVSSEQSEFAQALAAYTETKRSGSDHEVEQARQRVERLVAEPKPAAPDWGAGTRRPLPAEPNMSDILRRARWGY